MTNEHTERGWQQLVMPPFASALEQRVELPAPDMPLEEEIFRAQGEELEELYTAIVQRVAARLWIKSGILAQDEIELSPSSAVLIDSWRDDEPYVLRAEETESYSVGMNLDDEGQTVIFVFFYNNKVGRKRPTGAITCVIDEEGGLVGAFRLKSHLFPNGFRRQFYRKSENGGYTLFGHNGASIGFAEDVDILMTRAKEVDIWGIRYQN